MAEAKALDSERLGAVFAARPDIIQGIQLAADTPERIALFNNITAFVADQLTSSPDEPSAKRRRVDNGPLENGAAAGAPVAGPSPTPAVDGMLPPASAPLVPALAQPQQGHIKPSSKGSLLIDMANAAAQEVVLLEVKEMSVSIPQRKKYDVCFTKNYIYTRQVGTNSPVQGMVYDWRDIEYVFYTPIPEKAQLQYNYLLFPRNTALSSLKSFGPSDFEPLVFTVPTSAPKQGTVGGYAASTAASVSDSYSSLFHWAINAQLQSADNPTRVVGTDPRVFYSVVKQPHRPNERAVHVKAFRGSKDGYLFFLPAGILWCFKKPLLFLPLDRVVAVSYTNVLQRTFNMVVEVDVSQQHQQQQHQTGAAADKDGAAVSAPDSGRWVDNTMKTEEIEFAMIDQEDYAGIDETYVRRHNLQDRSMAERRKAKRELRENSRKGGAGEANGNGGADAANAGEEDDMTELERAEQALQDQEDEEEEDYDPGSEGESEGEGETSEEEDGEEGAEGYDEDGGEEEGYVEDHE